MPHGDHEVRPGEDVQFAELDFFGRVEVPGRPQDDEEGVVVAFQLAALVGLDGILDGQFMQPEQVAQLDEIVRVGLIEADPRHRFGIRPEQGCCFGQRCRAGDALAGDVDRVAGDGARGLFRGDGDLLGNGEAVSVAALGRLADEGTVGAHHGALDLFRDRDEPSGGRQPAE
ncbi:hypothetical protein SDC9_85004 [bioreactor metagenome]|uniref:Uncharacterized protein n=1 Tax=bioreactor metagenome TaxID=1076179 RepID=A0A644ZBW5_9ZZZZ